MKAIRFEPETDTTITVEFDNGEIRNYTKNQLDENVLKGLMSGNPDINIEQLIKENN